MKFATNADSCSVRFVSRGAANPAFGAHANAEVTESSEQLARVEGRANTQPRMQDGGQNGYKARSGKENFAGESSVTENPLADCRKQRI